MKTTKLLGTLLLTLVMILPLGLLASAAETGSITIHKYDTTDVVLTSDYADGSEQNGSTVVGTGNNGTVTLGELKPIPGIRFMIEKVRLLTQDELDAAIAQGTLPTAAEAELNPQNPAHYKADTTYSGTTVATDPYGIITWSGLPEGIYRITELENDTTDTVNNVDPFLVSIPMNDPADSAVHLWNVHVYPKNTVTSPTIIKKPVKLVDTKDNELETGDILGWKLSADIPRDIASATRYMITDTPSGYLVYVPNSLEVYYLNNAGEKVILDSPADYTLNTSGSIKVTLTATGKIRLGSAITGDAIEADRKLYVEYLTKITITPEQLKNLMESGNNTLINVAQVDFTNEAGYEYKPGKDEEETDVYGIKIVKVNQKDEPIKTMDARFKIYTTLNSDHTVNTASIIADSTGATEFTTDGDGCIMVAGLPAGTYYIVETQAPGGYNMLTGYTTVTVGPAPGATGTYDATTGLVTVKITNLAGFILPQTGGAGTLLFTVIGFILLTAAGVCILMYRNRKGR